MATVTVSDPAGYKVISSIHATLATVIGDVIDELAAHNISMNQIKFVLSFDDTGQEYTFMAICRT